MNIGFFVRHFTERGTEVAVYDYADHNETILGNKSIIYCFTPQKQQQVRFPPSKACYQKFQNRFEIKEINDFIFVSDASQSIKQIEAMVKRHIAKRKLDLLVVDYIQIVKREYSKNINEATAIKEITTGLKDIAKKYNIAVLGLAQINREGVNGKEPTMNDLKGSGGIEEDADCIILLHRPIADDAVLSSDGTFKVAKNRWGATKNIKFSFNGQITTFFEDL